MNMQNSIKPIIEGELPSQFADRLGIDYTKSVTALHKKKEGQFFTPTAIAKLMVSLSLVEKNEVKILDPGCGTAILSCALIEELVKKNNVSSIELVAYETDVNVVPYTQEVLNYLKIWLKEKDIRFKSVLHIHDFILDNYIALNNSISEDNLYDIIISNPPYFKLSKDDKRALLAKKLVSGQPNIYSIFMGVASQLLKQNGELIFITPRSFASGNYFKSFREFFFNNVQIERIHLFNSRKDTFSRDKVLQETVIVKANRQTISASKQVIVSSSNGLKDIKDPKIKYFKSCELIDLYSAEKILHLPTNEREEYILNLVTKWDNKLLDFGIQISTGPVVSFRSLEYIQNHYENGTIFLAPLYWLHNVNKMSLEWPISQKNKGQYIRILDKSKNLLIPNKNYILLRRFSTKDDKSRLIAAPFFSETTKSEYIGVENKVNYIYKVNGNLEKSELLGLCALLNSELFDIYFQIFNGNVNVSATELREMKFPSISIIKEIGKKLINTNNYSINHINSLVQDYFELEVIDN